MDWCGEPKEIGAFATAAWQKVDTYVSGGDKNAFSSLRKQSMDGISLMEGENSRLKMRDCLCLRTQCPIYRNSALFTAIREYLALNTLTFAFFSGLYLVMLFTTVGR
jgi:hypothetical protein